MITENIAISELIVQTFPKTKTEYLKKYPDNFDRDCHILYEFLSGNLGTVVPSEEVDEIWHWMILYTKKYSDFCYREFNRFIHHLPSDHLCSAPSENGRCEENPCGLCGQDRPGN
jgi:hypothetical protein